MCWMIAESLVTGRDEDENEGKGEKARPSLRSYMC